MSGKRNKNSGGKGGSSGGGTPPPPPNRVFVQVPQPLTVRHESTTEGNQRYREERRYRRGTLRAAQRLNRITLVGIFISFLGLGAVYLTIKLTRDQFIRSERPYVMVKGITTVPPPAGVVSTKFGANVTESNYGKSPAIDVIKRARIFDGKDAYAEAMQYAESLGDKRFEDSDSPSVGALPPNGSLDSFGTIVLDRMPTKEESERDLNTDGWIVVIGRIQYNDSFGTRYSTDFCKIHLALGNWYDCQKYNGIK